MMREAGLGWPIGRLLTGPRFRDEGVASELEPEPDTLAEAMREHAGWIV